MNIDPFLPFLKELDDIEKTVISMDLTGSAHDRLSEIAANENYRACFEQIDALLHDHLPDHWKEFSFRPNRISPNVPLTFGENNRLSALPYFLGYFSYALSLSEKPLTGKLKKDWASFGLEERWTDDFMAIKFYMTYFFKDIYCGVSLLDCIGQAMIDYVEDDTYDPTQTTPKTIFNAGKKFAANSFKSFEDKWDCSHALIDTLEDQGHLDGYERRDLEQALDNYQSDPGNHDYLNEIRKVAQKMTPGKKRAYGVTLDDQTATIIQATCPAQAVFKIMIDQSSEYCGQFNAPQYDDYVVFSLTQKSF